MGEFKTEENNVCISFVVDGGSFFKAFIFTERASRTFGGSRQKGRSNVSLKNQQTSSSSHILWNGNRQTKNTAVRVISHRLTFLSDKHQMKVILDTGHFFVSGFDDQLELHRRQSIAYQSSDWRRSTSFLYAIRCKQCSRVFEQPASWARDIEAARTAPRTRIGQSVVSTHRLWIEIYCFDNKRDPRHSSFLKEMLSIDIHPVGVVSEMIWWSDLWQERLTGTLVYIKRM